jgi:hypothetical protein
VDPIAAPLEILEMSDGEVRELVVTGYVLGTTTITPRDRQVSKQIDVVRLLVDHVSKSLFPYYYDLTAGTLTAQVAPLLGAVQQWPRVLRIAAYGVAPRRRYGVELLPYAPA